MSESNYEALGSTAAASTSPHQPWERLRLNAPQTDLTLFARPKLETAFGQVTANEAQLATTNPDLQGRSFQKLRQQAKQSVLAQAESYTSRLSGQPVTANGGPLIVSGHQPKLFHTGVWAKNFALARIAHETQGQALNLVVDNDTLSGCSIQVPVGNRQQPRLESVAFDDFSGPQPWEEATIQNEKRFHEFGDQLVARMENWSIEPVIASSWLATRDVANQSNKPGQLRDSLTAARYFLERSWGINNLEVPLSSICRQESFQWFAAHLLANLPEFVEVHNAVLEEYRIVNRVRSQTHPVPALAKRDGWFEAPFRIWREGETTRRRVFAQQRNQTLHLSDGEKEFAQLPLSPDMDACCAVEALQKLEASGLRFRTRALTTTLFSRMLLADLFVHGIGGAKYDEMTNQIIRRFYKIEPPEFQVISATVQLPFTQAYPVRNEDRTRLLSLQRDRFYNPQRSLSKIPETVADMVNKLQVLITEENTKADRPWDHGANYDRFVEMRKLRQKIQRLTAENIDRTELQTTNQALAANAMIQSREFSFALFPEAKLRPFLTQIAGLT